MFRILHYIYEVYREQSFSRAAQKLYVSQPSLSLSIKRYEKEIGVQIFDRSTVPVRLTDAGVAIVAQIRRILDVERDMQAYLEDYRELKTGSVTLGAAHMFASFLLPHLIARFLKAYPHIDLNIVESDFLSLQETALNGGIDLLIESHDFDPALFQTHPLFEEHVLLAVPLDDPLNRANEACALTAADILMDRHAAPGWPNASLGQFREHSFLMLEKGHDMDSRGLLLCRESGFEPKVFMRLNQLTTAYSLAGRQLGVTFVSDTAVKLCNLDGHLVYYKLAGKGAKRRINMVHKRNRYISRALGAFIAMVGKLSGEGISGVCKPALADPPVI